MKKNNIFYSVLLVFLAYANFSCSDSTIDNMFTLSMTDRPAQFTLSVDKSIITADYHASTQSINITSTDSWEVVSSADWISLLTSSGTGDGAINFELKFNPSEQSRSGNIQIKGVKSGKTQTINITQSYDNTPYLSFTASDEQIAFISGAINTIEYSVNGTDWHPLEDGNLLFGGVLGSLRFRGKSSYGTAIDGGKRLNLQFGTDADDRYALIDGKGDIRTLVNYEDYDNLDGSAVRFSFLFERSADLRSAPNLPYTKLASNGYAYMFADCSSLIKAPELPAVELASNCYAGMFRGCLSLMTAPQLSAVEMASSCYVEMFGSCTSLVQAPELPAKQLAPYCYERMFHGCTSLVKSPDLVALFLPTGCYDSMFQGCKSLNSLKVMAVNIDANLFFDLVFENSNLTLERNSFADYSEIYIPDSWNVIDRDPENSLTMSSAWTWPKSGACWGCYFYASENATSFDLNNVYGGAGELEEFKYVQDVRGDEQGKIFGDDQEGAYMIFDQQGRITSYDPKGRIIRSANYRLVDYDADTRHMVGGVPWHIGYLIVDDGGILWPYLWPYDQHNYGYKPHVFEILRNDDKLILCACNPDDPKPFSLATFWRFEATNPSNDKNPCETVVWQGAATCFGWDSTLRFCVGKTSEGILPWLDNDIYDWMVGKKMCLDISAADPGATVRVTTGWWASQLLDDIPIVETPCTIQFTFTQEFADACKEQDLLFTGNGNYTITKFYYEP